jgi:hypothetical protein
MTDPYRTAPEGNVESTALVRARTPISRRVYAWSGIAATAAAIGGIAAGAGVAVTAAVIAALVAVAGEGLLALGKHMEQQPAASELPFAIVHGDNRSAYEPSMPSCLDSVVIALRDGIAPVDTTVIVRGLHERFPGLAVSAETANGPLEQIITITEWPRSFDDRERLVQLLSTWGRDAHQRHPIREVWVRWKDTAAASY